MSVCLGPGEVAPRALAVAAPGKRACGGRRSAVGDAEQLPHERGSKGVDVLDVQQPPGVLGVDAAELSEHSHDLQEQEPAGRPQERSGVGPRPHPPALGPL